MARGGRLALAGDRSEGPAMLGIRFRGDATGPATRPVAAASVSSLVSTVSYAWSRETLGAREVS